MRETWVQSLGWEDPLEEGMATHSSILAWRTPMDRGAWGLQSMGSQRVGHDWVTLAWHGTVVLGGGEGNCPIFLRLGHSEALSQRSQLCILHYGNFYLGFLPVSLMNQRSHLEFFLSDLIIWLEWRPSSLTRKELAFDHTWVRAEPRTLGCSHCTTVHKIFMEKSSLFLQEQLWMPPTPHEEARATLGLVFTLPSTLCLTAVLTVLNCFRCQLSKVAFPKSLCPPGALGIQSQGRLATQKQDRFSGLWDTDLCLSAMVFPFLSQRRVTIWWFEGADERTAVIWAGWPRTWSLQAQQANPYLVFPSPHLRRSGSGVLTMAWGWEQDFELPSLSAGVCFHDRWWVLTWLYCPSLPALEGDFLRQQTCYTSRGNSICLWGQVQEVPLLSVILHPSVWKPLFAHLRPKE